MWVPSLRWIEAHRMQRKMPNCTVCSCQSSSGCGGRVEKCRSGVEWRRVAEEEYIHSTMPSLEVVEEASQSLLCRRGFGCQRCLHGPGFLALQSAHMLFPGTLCKRSCNAFSLRACWRLLINEAIDAWLPETQGRGLNGAGGIGEQRLFYAKNLATARSGSGRRGKFLILPFFTP